MKLVNRCSFHPAGGWVVGCGGGRVGGWLEMVNQTLEGPFSAVSKLIFQVQFIIIELSF